MAAVRWPKYNRIQVLPPNHTTETYFMQFRFIPVCGNAWIANRYYTKRK